MTEHDRELDSLVAKFAGDLRALFQKQMRAAFDNIVGASTRSQPTAAAAKPAAAKAPTPARPAAPARAAAAAKGGRRSDAEIAKTVARVKEYVAAHPGSRMEHIGAGLGLLTKVLTRPVAKLLASNEIRREGLKRATAYFPGSGGAAPAAKPAAAPASAKSAPKGKPKAKKPAGKAGANAAAPS